MWAVKHTVDQNMNNVPYSGSHIVVVITKKTESTVRVFPLARITLLMPLCWAKLCVSAAFLLHFMSLKKDLLQNSFQVECSETASINVSTGKTEFLACEVRVCAVFSFVYRRWFCAMPDIGMLLKACFLLKDILKQSLWIFFKEWRRKMYTCGLGLNSCISPGN